MSARRTDFLKDSVRQIFISKKTIFDNMEGENNDDGQLNCDRFGVETMIGIVWKPRSICVEYADDHVELIVDPLFWPSELANVPCPDLIGFSGYQFGLLVVGVSSLIASLFDLLVCL